MLWPTEVFSRWPDVKEAFTTRTTSPMDTWQQPWWREWTALQENKGHAPKLSQSKKHGRKCSDCMVKVIMEMSLKLALPFSLLSYTQIGFCRCHSIFWKFKSKSVLISLPTWNYVCFHLKCLPHSYLILHFIEHVRLSFLKLMSKQLSWVQRLYLCRACHIYSMIISEKLLDLKHTKHFAGGNFVAL